MDIKNLLSNAQSNLSNTYDTGVEALIDRLGLERQRSTAEIVLPAVGIFGAGLALGAVLGLVFAPKRGSELRHDLTDQIDHLKDRIDHLSVKSRRQYEDLLARGGDLVESAKGKIVSSSSDEEGEGEEEDVLAEELGEDDSE